MDGRTDGWTDGRMDERKNIHTYSYSMLYIHTYIHTYWTGAWFTVVFAPSACPTGRPRLKSDGVVCNGYPIFKSIHLHIVLTSILSLWNTLYSHLHILQPLIIQIFTFQNFLFFSPQITILGQFHPILTYTMHFPNNITSQNTQNIRTNFQHITPNQNFHFSKISIFDCEWPFLTGYQPHFHQYTLFQYSNHSQTTSNRLTTPDYPVNPIFIFTIRPILTKI